MCQKYYLFFNSFCDRSTNYSRIPITRIPVTRKPLCRMKVPGPDSYESFTKAPKSNRFSSPLGDLTPYNSNFQNLNIISCPFKLQNTSNVRSFSFTEIDTLSGYFYSAHVFCSSPVVVRIIRVLLYS